MSDKMDTGKDTHQLLSTFPEEIWMMIISDLLDDDNVLEALSNCSLYLRYILRNKRVLFLFPKVWKIFEPRFEDIERTDYLSRENLEAAPVVCASCGRLRFIQSYSEILKLRLVCRIWNQTIDNIHHSDPSLFETDDNENEGSDISWRSQLLFSGGRAEDFQQFYRHFAKSHSSDGSRRSPFIFKELVLEHSSVNQGHELYNRQLYNFLRKYGQHFRYCRIEILFQAPIVRTYGIRNSWLVLMPNLETLELKILPVYEQQLGERVTPTQQQFAELERVIHLNSLPVMNKLDYIKIQSCPRVIFANLVRRNSSISMLKIFQNMDTIYDVSSVPLSLQNLTKFSTTVTSEVDFLRLAVPLATCPVTKLQLNIELGEEGHVRWRLLFAELYLCDETLQELALTLPANETDARIANSSLRLELHNISFLTLTLPSYGSLDFILPMKKTLKYLDIRVQIPLHQDASKALVQGDEATGTIKFFSFMAKPMESNIWRIFTKLEIVRYYELSRQSGDRLVWSHRRGDLRKRPDLLIWML